MPNPFGVDDTRVSKALPSYLRGMTNDFNRATKAAKSAKEARAAEKQLVGSSPSISAAAKGGKKAQKLGVGSKGTIQAMTHASPQGTYMLRRMAANDIGREAAKSKAGGWGYKNLIRGGSKERKGSRKILDRMS